MHIYFANFCLKENDLLYFSVETVIVDFTLLYIYIEFLAFVLVVRHLMFSENINDVLDFRFKIITNLSK